MKYEKNLEKSRIPIGFSKKQFYVGTLPKNWYRTLMFKKVEDKYLIDWLI